MKKKSMLIFFKYFEINRNILTLAIHRSPKYWGIHNTVNAGVNQITDKATSLTESDTKRPGGKVMRNNSYT